MAGFALSARARLAGYRLTAFDAVGSTNVEAREAAIAGDRGGHWFAALQQTAGRGRRGRAWETPHGNLAASLLILPDADTAHSATLGFVAGVALHRALSSVLPATMLRIGIDGADSADRQSRIALKWPNDVLADGAKLAGILLEAVALPNGRQAVVIGMGINVVAAPKGLPYPAASLNELGSTLDAARLFEALTEHWVDAFSLWRDGQGIADVLGAWRSAAAGIGAEVAVTQDGVVVRGVFETIDESGRLIVRAHNDARIAITAGDVHFGATASVR